MLQTRALINRTAYQARQVQVQKRSDRTQEQSAKIVNYDPSTGYYKVINTSGQTFLAKAISNSGALSKGAQVSLVIPVGGVPIIDAMPR